MKAPKPLFRWRSAIVSANLSSTSKLVALALSLYMDERGRSAFPSLARLSSDTSLSRRTVQRHLHALRDAGWLIESERAVKTAGGPQKVHSYRIKTPRKGGVTGPPPCPQRGCHPDAPLWKKGVSQDTKGGVTVTPHYSMNTSLGSDVTNVTSAPAKNVENLGELLAGPIREHLWLGKTPPSPGWTMGKELSIARQMRKRGYSGEEILGIVHGIRIVAEAGLLTHVSTGEPCTLRVVQRGQVRGAMPMAELALHWWRKATGAPDVRTRSPGPRHGGRDARRASGHGCTPAVPASRHRGSAREAGAGTGTRGAG